MEVEEGAVKREAMDLSSEPEASEPEASEPEASEPEASEPEASEPDGAIELAAAPRIEIPPGENRVLVANPSAPSTRLIRETLENFTSTRVETTSDFLRAFELALQKRYRLFFFGMRIGEYSGPMLYELISKAYSTGYGLQKLAPAVVFVRNTDDPKLPHELERDARVRAVLSKPIRIDRLLKSVEGVLEVRDPTAR